MSGLRKVALVAGRLSTRASGIKNVVEGLSAALVRRGLDVRVFGLSDKAWCYGDYKNWEGAPATVLRTFGPEKFGYAPGMVTEILRWNPDVVHLHGIWMYSARAAHIWAKKTGKGLLISPHGMLSSVALRYSRLQKFMAGKVFHDNVLDDVTCLHATSETEAEQFRNYGLTAPISIFPNGININQIAIKNHKDRENKVVTLGRYHKIKGLDRLIKAWARIEPTYHGWSLEIAGSDNDGYRRHIEKLIKELELKKVTLKGPLYGVDKDEFLASAKLFVLPTLSDNFALTVAEALMLQTPVISTYGAPWRGLEEKHCGMWIDHGEDVMATALSHAIGIQDAERAIMGRNGREWMLNEFSWDAVAIRAEDSYRNVYEQTFL